MGGGGGAELHGPRPAWSPSGRSGRARGGAGRGLSGPGTARAEVEGRRYESGRACHFASVRESGLLGGGLLVALFREMATIDHSKPLPDAENLPFYRR